jgi:hypothetical protein
VQGEAVGSRRRARRGRLRRDAGVPGPRARGARARQRGARGRGRARPGPSRPAARGAGCVQRLPDRGRHPRGARDLRRRRAGVLAALRGVAGGDGLAVRREALPGGPR